MKRELISAKGAIIPVSVFTIPTPVRGFGWAVRTTFAAAKRFWEDTEEVRWLAWEGTKKAGVLAGRLGLKAGIGLGHMAVGTACIIGKTVPMIWQKGRKAIPGLWRGAKAGLTALWDKMKSIGNAIGEEALWLASNVAGGLMVLTLLLAEGISAMLEAGCSVVQKARDGLASAWRFREELIEEWA